MKRILSILFTVFLLLSACFAFAEGDASKTIITPIRDLGIMFARPGNFVDTENSGELTEDGLLYFGFHSADTRVDLYLSPFKDMSEAEAWVSERDKQLKKLDLNINGLNAIEYRFSEPDENGNDLFWDFLFFENEEGAIIEFWETTYNGEISGTLKNEIYPISFFDNAISSNSESEKTPSGDTGKSALEILSLLTNSESEKTPSGDTDSKSEESPSADPVTESTSGVCTANQVNLRTEPKSNARSIGQISKGEQLEILESEGEWSKIKCSKGEGYIKTQYIEMQ